MAARPPRRTRGTARAPRSTAASLARVLVLVAVAAVGGSPPAVAQESAPSAPAVDDLAAERARLEEEVAARPADAALRLRLGDLLARQGEIDAALARFAQAADLATAANDRAAANLAIAILERRRGDATAALRHYDLALDAAPGEPLALRGAATLLAQLSRYRDAVPYYGRLIAAEPGDPRHRIGGATALILAGEHLRARIALEQARATFPDDLTLLDILARHLAACPDRSVRDGARAVELAGELVEKVPTAESHETLAMAHAEAGAFDRAAAEQKELIARFADEVEPAVAERWRTNLKLYEAGKSCCAGE